MTQHVISVAFRLLETSELFRAVLIVAQITFVPTFLTFSLLTSQCLLLCFWSDLIRKVLLPCALYEPRVYEYKTDFFFLYYT